MALLSVLEYPDPKLRQKTQSVTKVDAKIQRIVDDMFETMYTENGVGLAAIQVNIPLKIITIDISEDKKTPLTIINPEIIFQEGIQYEYEGCLSFPGVYDKVERSAHIHIQALDRQGKSIEIKADGLLSVCIQHEIDHINGIMFIDHLSRLKQERMRKKLEKGRRRVASE